MKLAFFALSALLALLWISVVLAQDSDLKIPNHSLDEIQNSILNNQGTCLQIINDFITRIQHFDTGGKKLRSVSMINTRAIDQAKELDTYTLSRNALSGPLHCLPILVADDVDVADLPTTLGLKMFRNLIPRTNSAVVQILRAQGAVVVAKTNVDAGLQLKPSLSNMSRSETIGMTHSPFGYMYTTYGRNGGNAAANAAQFGLVGIGTDSSGSFLVPAAATNLVAFRPTSQSFSLDGVFPVNDYMMSISLSSKKVEPIITTYAALTGSAEFFNVKDDFNPQGLRGIRIGVWRELFYSRFDASLNGERFTYELEDEMMGLINNAFQNMQLAEASLRNFSFPISGTLRALISDIFDADYNMKSCSSGWITAYLNRLGRFKSTFKCTNYPCLTKLPDISARARQYLEQSFINRTSCEYNTNEFVALRDRYAGMLSQMFLNPSSGQYFDLIAIPVLSVLPQTISQASIIDAYSSLYSGFAKFPTLTLPIGFSRGRYNAPQGVPASLLLISNNDNESILKLFKATYAYQVQFGVTKLPFTVSPSSLRGNCSTKTPTILTMVLTILIILVK